MLNCEKCGEQIKPSKRIFELGEGRVLTFGGSHVSDIDTCLFKWCETCEDKRGELFPPTTPPLPEMIDIPPIQGDNTMSEEDAVQVITVYKCTCQRCGHEWIARKKPPGTCAKCRNPNWRTPRAPRKTKDDKPASCG